MTYNADPKVVQAYLSVLTKEDIKTINRWTAAADVPFSAMLALSKKLQSIEPVPELKIFRGIGFGLSYQEKMGLFEKKTFGWRLKDGVRKGTEFEYSTPRPLSFSTDLFTARAFGKVVVTSTLTLRHKYINITEAFWNAANSIDAASLFHEVILLEINKDMPYTVLET